MTFEFESDHETTRQFLLSVACPARWGEATPAPSIVTGPLRLRHLLNRLFENVHSFSHLPFGDHQRREKAKDLLIIGDSILTDRHHASNGNYDPTDPQNQIGGIIPSFSLSGWLRHGMERVVQDIGATACHPGEANANFRKEDVYSRDLEAGYHEKGECLDGNSDGCVILDLFGGFDDRPGKVMRRPIKFSPVRSAVDYRRGQAEGHYRRLNRNVVSRNEADIRQPLRNIEVDAVANLDGCWQLAFRETKREFIGLLAEAVEYLNTHQTAFMHQLGGARNFGGGIVDCELVNPLYEANEFHRVFNRSAGPSAAMEAKNEEVGG